MKREGETGMQASDVYYILLNKLDSFPSSHSSAPA
jgi:hypothetical protein